MNEAVEFGYWLINQEHKYNRNYSKEQVENYFKFFLEEKVERLKGKPYDFEVKESPRILTVG